MPSLVPIVDLSELTIVPSFVCRSANCIGCYKKSLNGYAESCKNSLDLDVLMPFLRRYTSIIRVHSFGITGGEPTEYGECCSLVGMLTDEFPGIQLELVTNGQDHMYISGVLDTAHNRENFLVGFSIDGFGPRCDRLRGKDGYFSEVLMSIEEMAKGGRISNTRINTRYFPEYEDSIIELSSYLESVFGITREQFSLGSVTYRLTDHPDADSYLTALQKFVGKFWTDASQINVPHTPSFLMKKKPYNRNLRTSFCCPSIHPDGHVSTCDTPHGLEVGNIRNDDVVGVVTRMLNVVVRNPDQCEKCRFGQCVLKYYEQFT